MKHYKPGQFVSICGKLARAYRRNPAFFTCELSVCDQCMLANGWKRKNYCCLHSSECSKKLGPNLYPKLICGNQAK